MELFDFNKEPFPPLSNREVVRKTSLSDNDCNEHLDCLVDCMPSNTEYLPDILREMDNRFYETFRQTLNDINKIG